MSDPATEAAAKTTALLATKLRALREDRGLSQQETANRAGINLRSYQRVETNLPGSTSARRSTESSNPRLDTIFKVAFALESPVAYLVDPEVDPKPVPPPVRPAALVG